LGSDPGLAGLLVDARGGDGATALERLVYGTPDADAAAALVLDWCRAAFGVDVADAVFFVSSVGCVHGLVLADGRRVVVKAFQANASVEYLVAVQRLQLALGDAGLPAPRPLVGPRAFGAGLATAETMLPRPPSADAHDPGVRRILAEGLARFVRSARRYIDEPGLRLPPFRREDDEALYPRVHDPRFDFAATSAGAEWIDRLARDALDRRNEADGPRVVGHMDWRIQNVGVSDGELVAIFDWDSIAIGLESGVAAAAAYGFCHDWSTDRPAALTTVDEMFAFIADYEQARDIAFTTSERRIVEAQLVYSLSYGARCEHSDARLDGAAPHDPVASDGMRGLLIALAQRLGCDIVGEPGVHRG
jgi:hypothetical protein